MRWPIAACIVSNSRSSSGIVACQPGRHLSTPSVGDNGEVNQLEMLKRRLEKKERRVEQLKGGQVKWDYRRDIIKREGLVTHHYYLGIGFLLATVLGVCAFIAVKTRVIHDRRRAMLERERARMEAGLSPQQTSVNMSAAR